MEIDVKRGRDGVYVAVFRGDRRVPRPEGRGTGVGAAVKDLLHREFEKMEAEAGEN